MPLDLDSIKARLAAASEGPWRWVRAYEHRGVHWCLENDKSAALGSTINHNLVTLSTDEYEYDDEGRPTSLSETPDFQLIEHAPTDIAALISEIERLRAAILATYTAPNPVAWFAAERALREVVGLPPKAGE